MILVFQVMQDCPSQEHTDVRGGVPLGQRLLRSAVIVICAVAVVQVKDAAGESGSTSPVLEKWVPWQLRHASVLPETTCSDEYTSCFAHSDAMPRFAPIASFTPAWQFRQASGRSPFSRNAAVTPELFDLPCAVWHFAHASAPCTEVANCAGPV